jgi:hypothetical protein
VKKLLLYLLFLSPAVQSEAQSTNCVFKKPVVTINFGTGDVSELNSQQPQNYVRVSRFCPTDGHYSYTSYTSDCFRGDWLTLAEDHTPGDQDGNMMIVNASPRSGVFLTTNINGLKANTNYEFSAWMMNVCKPTEKCPFPLLPNITVRVETPAGRVIALFNSGDLPRHDAPHWTPYRAMFTTPSTETPLRLIMVNNAPGGCGNDFALDDISFRECEKPKPVTAAVTKPPVMPKPQPKKQVVVKQQPKQPVPPKPQIKKEEPARRPLQTSTLKAQTDTSSRSTAASKPKPIAFASRPAVLMTRSNPVIRQIAMEAGEIKVDLYDNGQIDGDTVTIYHNNVLLVSKRRLSEKPITLRIAVNKDQPHHELVMVAENLGSIPPNTSLMVVTAGDVRHEIFISSTEQKNAKIVINLKE